jgi:hypothetical protein
VIPILVFVVVLVGLLVRYIQLRVLLSRSESTWMKSRDVMLDLGQEFGRYAFSHQGFLPEKLEVITAVLPENDKGYVYRYVPQLDCDGRLILVYDETPRHAMMAFPKLVYGRHVLFASGKVELFEEGVVHQLIVGDNVLRNRLDLPEIPFMEVWDGGT